MNEISPSPATGSDCPAARRFTSLQKRKALVYKKLYEFTYGACGSCAESGCACKDRICQHVEEQALKRGHTFKHTGHALRFIGCSGCVIPPHLRETCTLYICQKAQNSPSFDRLEYARLISLSERVELQLMALEDTHGLKALVTALH